MKILKIVGKMARVMEKQVRSWRARYLMKLNEHKQSHVRRRAPRRKKGNTSHELVITNKYAVVRRAVIGDTKCVSRIGGEGKIRV